MPAGAVTLNEPKTPRCRLHSMDTSSNVKIKAYATCNVLGASEITANLYCNFEYLYWEGCVICSIYLR